MRSLTSLHESRVHGPQNFRSPVQNDFCNKIGTKLPIPSVAMTASLGDRTDMLCMGGEGQMRRPRYTSLRRFAREGIAAAGKILICGLNDISPHCLNRLLALGREVVPGFGLVEGERLVQAVPLGDGHALGSPPPFH